VLETKVISLVFRSNWKLTLFYLLLLPILVGLGFWQLQRADFKQGLQDIYEQRSAAVPIELSELMVDQSVAYMQVKLQGQFDNDHHFLLDNRVLNGRTGYEVISAFKLIPSLTMANGQQVEMVWINRGWIPMLATRSELPAIASVEQRQIITGQLVVPSKAFVLADVPMADQWPEVIQSVELDVMSERLSPQLQLQSVRYLFRLATGEPGSFEVNWQPVNSAPQKSLGYAVQWFLMALVLSGLYFWTAIKQK